MKKQVLDNLAYFYEINRIMSQQIQDSLNRTAEQQVLEQGTAKDRTLYEENYGQWKKANKRKLKTARGKLNGNAIPHIMAKNINNAVVNADGSFVMQGARKAREQQYKDIDTEAVIGAIGPENLSDIADPNAAYHGNGITKSSTQLQHQHTKWRVAQSNADMVAGVKNAQSKGEFVAFDTETLGGQDEFGKQRYDAVTEITIKRKKYNAEAETIESFGGAIGFTQEQKDFGEKVYAKVKAGAKLTGREAVWAHRLSLIGMSTAVQAKGKANGVYEYSHFADKDEIRSGDPEYIRQGIDKGFALGEAQRKAGKVTYAKKEMYAWEADTFKGIDAIIDNELTAVGHNTVNFDRKALQWLLQKGMWSAGAKQLAQERLQRLTARNGDLHFDYEVDTEAVQNQFSETRLDNFLDVDENGNPTVDKEALKAVKERGLTLGQQEAIGRKLYPHMYDGANVNAHTSDVDVDVVGKIFTSSKYRLGTKDSFFNQAMDANGNVAAPSSIKGDGNELFYMTRSHTASDLSKNGLLGFVMDDVDDYALTSFEGVTHNADGTRKLIYKPGALQKGVSYSITNVSALSLSKDLQEQFAKVQPDADMSNLIAIEWTPVYDKSVDPGMRKNRRVVTIGARFNQETLMNESALLYAAKDANGEYQFTDDEEVKKLLQIRKLNEKGELVGMRDATVRGLLRESSENMRDGGALRALREHSLKKDLGLLQYADDMKKWGEANGTDDLKRRFYEAVSEGKTDRSLADYFGYVDEEGKKVVESPTISSAMNRLDFAEKNRNTIIDAAERAFRRSGSGRTVTDALTSDISKGMDADASYYYKSYMDALTDAAKNILTNGKHNVGIINEGSHAYELNKVEIDMNGFQGKHDYKEPFRVNLNAGGKTNFNNLAHYLGKRADMAQDQAVALLADFQKHLAKSRSLDSFGSFAKKVREEQLGNFKIDGNDTLDSAFAKISYSLTRAKNSNPSGGMMTATEKYNLLVHKAEFGFSESQRKIVLDSAEKTTAELIRRQEESDKIFGREVTNKILYNGNTDIQSVKKQFMDAGYSEHDAEKAAYIREQQRRDTEEVMTKIAGLVRRNGGSIGMDAKSKSVYIDANGKRTVLDRLPQNIMENGVSYVKSGGSRFYAPVGFYATNIYSVRKGMSGKLDYRFMSKIGAEFHNMGYVYSSAARAAERGQLGEGIQDIIGDLAHRVSQATAVADQDLAEMRIGGNIHVGGILPLVAREDVWNDLSSKIDFDDPYTGEGNRALRAAVEKIQKSKLPALPDDYKAFSADVGLSTALRDIMPELHKYLDSDSQGMMRSILGDNYQDFSVYTKAAGHGMVNVYRDMHQYGTNLTSNKRKTEEFVGKAKKFYTDETALDGRIEGLSFGRALNTEAGRAYAEDAGEDVARSVNDAIRTKYIRMTTGTLKEIAANANLSQETRDMLFGSHLTEGAAIVDPRMIDAFWHSSNAIQKVRDEKVVDVTEDGLDHLWEKNKMAARINISKDGSVNFRYSKGLFFETTELSGKTPVAVKGYLNNIDVESKERGLWRMGYFTRKNNLLVSEEEIRQLLNKQENLKRIARAQDAAQEVTKILKEKYEAYYYNTSISVNTDDKIALGGEKGMHNALFGYLGSGGLTKEQKAEDEMMRKALSALGAEELMKFIPNKELIESLKSNNIANTALGAYLKGKNGKSLTHKEIIGRIASKLNLTEEETKNIGSKLYDIAVRERYNPWDETIHAVGGAMGLSESEMKQYHEISNFVDYAKHKDFPSSIADGLLEKGFSLEKTAEILRPALGDVRVVKDKNGAEALVADPESINLNALQKISKDYGLESTKKFWTGDGKIISDEATYNALSGDEKKRYKENVVSANVGALSRLPDQDRARSSDAMKGKTWKYDYRSQAMANVDRYSEEHIKDIQSGLVEALQQEGMRVFNEHFRNAEVGKRIGEGVFQSLERAHWYTPGKMRVMIHGDVDQRFLSDSERDEIAKAYASLKRHGIKKDFVDAVVETAKKGFKSGGEYVEGSNADYVSVDKVKAHYSLNQHILADRFNKGIATMDDIVKAGFNGGAKQIITMDELFTPDSNFKDVEGDLYGKSAFLDLHIEGLEKYGIGQVYKDESQRYIALPWTDQNITEESDKVIKNLYQKKVSSMLNAVSRVNSGVDEKGNPLKKEDLQKYHDTISGYAEEIKHAIVQSAFDKNGIVHRQLGTSFIGMSAFNKAYGVELTGKESSGFWGNISFDGFNVKDLESKGKAVIDFQVGSLELRNRFFNDHYFANLGFRGKELHEFRNAVFETLNTEGTLSTNSRNPQGYDKSTSSAVMYFDKSVHGNMLAVSAAMWESKKGDYDSDEAISHVLTGDVVITKDGKKIVANMDYATFSKLQEMAENGTYGVTDVTAPSHARKMWDDARSQIWSQSVTRNVLADKNVRQRIKDSNDALTEVSPEHDMKYMFGESLEGKGKYYADSLDHHLIAGEKYRDLSAGQRTLMRSQYEDVMEKARKWQNVSEDKFSGMAEEERRNLYAGYVHHQLGGNKEAMNALGLVLTEHRELKDAIAMKRNAAAGQMNNAVFQLLRVADASGQFDKDGTIRGVAAIHTSINEAFLSPKNEKDIVGIRDIDRLTAATKNVYNLITQAHPSKQKIREADKELENIALDVLEKRGFKELNRYVPGFEEKMKSFGEGEEADKARAKFARDYVHQTFGSIGARIQASGFDMKTFDIGMKEGKPSYSSTLEVAYGGLQNTNMNDMVLQEAAAIGEHVGGSPILRQNAAFGGRSEHARQAIQLGTDTSSPLRESSHAKPPTIGDLGRGAASALSKIRISDSRLLKGMMTVGAGLMASGIAGGVDATSPRGKNTPPQSATTQAAGASEAEYAPVQQAQVPNLSDSNVNVLRGGPQSGYVINIAASSPQGSDAARNAITQALGSSVPVNTSMNINMNTNYQDQVNQLQISRILGNML